MSNNDDNPYSDGEVVIRFPIHKSNSCVKLLKSPDFKFAIQDFDNKLRAIIKYEDDSDTSLGVQRARDILHETLGESDLNIWDDE